ncbi:hypothetical protein DLAC_11569 [Tieghemostelium lacteum]|uniref:Uncharacterized protein n=1 Tax=Tieghemostelium lacteum TaxID=361077 RepID=A0A151ZSA6_TIELA|nr:hypothetical protein DLAC_11569 [Tieghemostelium lacteum]|eukprot:KYQ96654.1 hypothetical protein DLAC_11569 [Tieghemostelium lacteum]
MKGFLNVLSKKDKKSSIKLEETNSNNNNKKSYDYCVNALVLGLVQSGKTTLQRQLEILYGLETIDKKFCQKTIYGNTLSTLIMLIEGTEALNINLDPYNVERVDRVKSCPIELAKDRLPRFPLKLSYDCKCLWEDSSIQMVYNHSKFCSQFRIPGRSKYYMDNMFRVFSPEFIPNELDILSLYAPGEKSSISSVLHRRLKMEMISCPGTESTPKDWINLYNLYRPHYLFYVVSLKDYIIDNINLCTSELVGELPASSRETCSHHQHKNQLLESLKTFETLVNSELFEKSYSVILIFNINEIFYESVKLFDFKHTFPDYDGADDPDKAITYITNKFTKYLIEKNKPYQALNINLLQKSNIKDAYEEILDFLIPDAEKRNLIYDITSPTAIDAQHQQHQQQQQSNGSGPNTPQMNSVTSTLSHSGSSISSSRDSTTSNSSSKHRKRNNSDSSNHPSSVLPSAVSTIGTGPPSNHMNMIQSLNIDTHIELKETTTTTTTTSTTTSNNSSSNSNSSSNNVKSPSKVKDKKAINLPKQQKRKRKRIGKC